MNYWILVADASRGLVLSTSGRDKPLRLERQLENPQGRARTQELVTDEPGRLRKGAAPGTRSAMEPRTAAHEGAAEHFAAELAEMLREEFERGSFGALAIVAPPHLLGLLRSRLTKEVERQLRAWLARDLIHLDPGGLRPHLEPLFGPGIFV